MFSSKTTIRWPGPVLAIALVTPLVACSDDVVEPPASTPNDIVSVAQKAGTFNTLTAALDSAGLTATLQTGGPFTVFAPTDAAFEALPTGTLDALLADRDALAEVLLYHVASGNLLASDLEGRASVATLQGQDLAITLSSIQLNGVPVSQADIRADNGVIHVIDEVLLPPSGDLVRTAVAAGSFTTLLTALEATGLDAALQGEKSYTVFAPTDAAFASLPLGTLDALLANPAALSEVLLYHVVEGKVYSGDLSEAVSAQTLADFPILFKSAGAQVNTSLVGPANVLATNGVIHVIDQVLLPPSKDIVETAIDAGFSTLATALQAADLVGALQADGPFTVFAPTDAAFAALPAGTLDALLQDPQALADVLLYHVVDGQIFAGNLMGVSAAATLQGQSISIDLTDGVRINDAAVTSTDIITKNGVIHVIDKVLLPR